MSGPESFGYFGLSVFKLHFGRGIVWCPLWGPSELDREIADNYALGMVLARNVGRMILATALVAYAFDCEAMTTAESAMQCCASMHCSRQGRMDANQGMDCCKTMPAAHAPFVQSALESGALHSTAVLAVLPVFYGMRNQACSSRSVAERVHAPPGNSLPALTPLRI
jgi:hypothetical protein